MTSVAGWSGSATSAQSALQRSPTEDAFWSTSHEVPLYQWHRGPSRYMGHHPPQMGAALHKGWGHLKGSYLKSGKMPGRGGFVFGKELHVQGNRLQVDSKSILNAPFGREDSCANLLPLAPAKTGPGAGMSLWHCSSWTEKWGGVRWVGAGRFAREREQPALLTHALPSFPSRAGGQVVLSSSQSRDCKIRCEGRRFTLERSWTREDKFANLQTLFVRNTFCVCVCVRAWAAFFNVHDAQIRLSQKQMA